MDFNLTQEQLQIREEIRRVCREFSDPYWREVDKKRDYPEAFVRKLTELGWLAALIPEEYGGTGLGITEASIILEEINHSGGNATACHAQMYTMGTLLKHGSEEQKKRYLSKIASGELRLQAFGVTEPNAGSETTRIQTTAVRKGDKYVVDGQKIFISRVLQSDLMLLLARTTPYDALEDKTRGLSAFIVDLREAKGKIEVKPLDLMINHHTTALFFDGLEVPVENLIGQEGMGFRYIIDGWNAERILVAAEAIGDGRGLSNGPPNMPGSAWSSAGRSARIKGSSFRSPRRIPASKPRILSVIGPPRCSTARSAAGRRRIWPNSWPRRRHGRRRTSVSPLMVATVLRRSTMWNESSARPGFSPWRR